MGIGNVVSSPLIFSLCLFSHINGQIDKQTKRGNIERIEDSGGLRSHGRVLRSLELCFSIAVSPQEDGEVVRTYSLALHLLDNGGRYHLTEIEGLAGNIMVDNMCLSEIEAE